MGKWSLFVGPTAHHEVIDDQGYLVVGSGAHAPPIQINADGSYVWTLGAKPAIQGRWRTLAEYELRPGIPAPAVLLMKGESGKDWIAWKSGVNAGNNRDALGLRRVDLGITYQGTRLP